MFSGTGVLAQLMSLAMAVMLVVNGLVSPKTTMALDFGIAPEYVSGSNEGFFGLSGPVIWVDVTANWPNWAPPTATGEPWWNLVKGAVNEVSLYVVNESTNQVFYCNASSVNNLKSGAVKALEGEQELSVTCSIKASWPSGKWSIAAVVLSAYRGGTWFSTNITRPALAGGGFWDFPGWGIPAPTPTPTPTPTPKPTPKLTPTPTAIVPPTSFALSLWMERPCIEVGSSCIRTERARGVGAVYRVGRVIRAEAVPGSYMGDAKPIARSTLYQWYRCSSGVMPQGAISIASGWSDSEIYQAWEYGWVGTGVPAGCVRFPVSQTWYPGPQCYGCRYKLTKKDVGFRIIVMASTPVGASTSGIVKVVGGRLVIYSAFTPKVTK